LTASSLPLPLDADRVLPHRRPMRLLDRLLSVTPAAAVAEARPDAACLFAEPGGRLHPAALLELIAQGYAAMRGYKSQNEGEAPARGFLTAVKRFEVLGEARVGERLEVRIADQGSVGDFSIGEGEVFRDDLLLAHASIRVWTEPEERGEAS